MWISKQLSITGLRMQGVGLVQCVPCLVSEDAAAFRLPCAFAFQHLRALEAHQAWMRQIKGDGEAERPVRSEELLGQPDVWARHNIAGGKFSVKPGDTVRHQGVFKAQG
jgi:hypothetical protein